MARIDYGIMGGFSGKVGTVVGYYWNGKPVMRAYKRQIHDAHVYLMVQADDGRWSHSLYAGEIAMDEVVGGEEVTSGPVETAHSAPTAQNVSATNISPSHNNSDKSAFSEKIKKSPS